MSDYFKWLLVAFFAILGVLSSYFYMDQSFILRFGLLCFATALSAFVGFTTTSGVQAWRLVKSAPNEVRKVSWPHKNETVQITMIILVMVIVLMFLVWGIDSILLKFISMFTGRGV